MSIESEVTMGYHINHIVANNKEELDRAVANNEPTVFSFHFVNLEKLVRHYNFINDIAFKEKSESRIMRL